MPLSQEIDAYSLLRPYVRAPEGVTPTEAVLPFFTEYLDVRLLLVVLHDGHLVVTRDLPQRVARRTLFYSYEPRLDRPLAEMSPREIAPLFHFDPWWLLRERRELPEAVRKTALATNIAGRQLAGGELRTVYFDDALLNVVAARIHGGPSNRGRLSRDELLKLMKRAKW